MDKDVVFEIVDGVSAKGNKYKSLQITLKNIKIDDELVEDIKLQPIFLDNMSLIALKSKLKNFK